MSSDEVDVSQTLNDIAEGHDSDAERLMPLVYDQMRALAGSMINQEIPGHTLQPTALVNEAYLKLADQNRVNWKGKTHFFAIGAKVMRRILVDHARGRKRQKRGGGMRRITLGDDMKVSSRNDEDVLAIEEALTKLAELDPRQVEIIEMRFFGGMTVEEVAEVLSVSKRTVESDWTMARAWLRRELTDNPSS